MTNRSRTLYTGMTGSLIRRVREHKQGTGSRFTTKYKLDRLVYFQRYCVAIGLRRACRMWRILTASPSMVNRIRYTWGLRP